MAYIIGVLQEERQRLLAEKAHYEEDLRKTLPAGTIVKKRIRGHAYPYFQYRDKQHIRSIYIKAGELEAYQERVEQRAMIRQALREINENLMVIDKSLGKSETKKNRKR